MPAAQTVQGKLDLLRPQGKRGAVAEIAVAQDVHGCQDADKLAVQSAAVANPLKHAVKGRCRHFVSNLRNSLHRIEAVGTCVPVASWTVVVRRSCIIENAASVAERGAGQNRQSSVNACLGHRMHCAMELATVIHVPGARSTG